MLSFSVFELLSEAWRLSLRRRQFWIFGSILALPVFAQTLLLSDFPKEAPLFPSYVTTHPRELISFLLVSLVASLLGKAGLVLSFHLSSKNDTSRLTSATFFQSVWRSCVIDGAVLLFLLSLGLFLIIPFLVSFFVLDSIPPTLHWLALVVVIPVTIVMLIVREFTYFYFLLTPGLRFRSALNASITLFQKHSLPSLQFILIVLFLTFLFTFSLNLAMLSIVALSHLFFPTLSTSVIITVGSFLALSLFEMIRQGLWFLYFERLAKPKNPIQAETVGIEKEIEMPSA